MIGVPKFFVASVTQADVLAVLNATGVAAVFVDAFAEFVVGVDVDLDLTVTADTRVNLPTPVKLTGVP